MLPDEIYAGSNSSSSRGFKYGHPLARMLVDDGSMRACLAYDLMTFMGREECGYYYNPDVTQSYEPETSDDEIDILIVDGFYKEAKNLVNARLKEKPDDEKAIFQKAFIDQLKDTYKRIIEREDVVLATDPKNVSALINKAFALANLECEEDALTLLDKALVYEPDNIMALSNKAYIAKMLWRDKDHDIFLKQAYNASAKHRHREISNNEARLLRDMDSAMMRIETPKAFIEFNRRSGAAGSDMVH